MTADRAAATRPTLRPTIRDVAARAGVSIATVSRSLNARGAAHADTAARVREAAAALGFRPNPAGRALKTARTGVVGVVVPSLRNPVFADMVAGVEIAANAAGYGVVVATSGYDLARETAAAEALLAHRVDGLVLTVADAARSAALDNLVAARAPHILVYNESGGAGGGAIGIDNRAAGEAVGSALIGAGHRRLAMLAGDFAASDRQGKRRDGFLASAARAGLPVPAVHEVPFGARRFGPGFARLFDGATAATGLFCATDLLAIAAIRELKELGLAVPRDVSVVGFDGIALGEAIVPSLATVVQPNGAMGEAAFAFLKDRIDGAARPAAPILLPFQFRPGETLGAPPGGVPGRSATAGDTP